MYVLGGEDTPYVASFEVNTEFEDVEIIDLQLNLTGADLSAFVNSVREVVLYDESGNVIESELVNSNASTNGYVQFRNIDYVIDDEENSNINVALVTKKLGFNAIGNDYGSTDFSFAMEITDSEGVNSDVTIVTPSSLFSKNVAVKPVLISDLEIEDETNELTASADLATINITADTWTNNQPDTSSAAELQLIELALNVNATLVGTAAVASDFTLRLEDGQGTTVAATSFVGGIAVFDLVALGASESILTSAEVESLLVEFSYSSPTSEGDNIQIEFNENNGSYLSYSVKTDAACAQVSCV